MKRSLIILAAAFCLGIGGYYFVFERNTIRVDTIQAQPAPELVWLKTEYKLSNDEFARICAMHISYMPGCAQMCEEIKEQNTKIQRLIASTNTVTPEIEIDLKELAALRVHCQMMMLRHFYAVSKTMPPAQGKRYMAEMQRQTSLLNPDLMRR
jgi:hypothetical protein